MQRKVVALRAVKDAGAFLQKHFRSKHQGTKKADGTMVSEADKGSEKRIMQALRKAFPNDAILSEERGEIQGDSGYRWILDPLDGTHNFLSGIPLFGILLALEHKGKVILSICAFPVLDEFFVAEKGKGATLNGKKIHVSSAKTLDGGMFLGDGNSTLPLQTIVDDIKPFHDAGARFRLLGSGPFGLTRVALGTVPAAFVRFGKLWDLAAPCLLVEEAGGKVTDGTGKPWKLEPRPLLATNGSLHKEALVLLGAKS